MRGCSAFEELSTLVDGELPRNRDSEVGEHLEECVACQRQVRGLTALKQAVGRVYDSEVPPSALRRLVIAWLINRHRIS